MLLEGLGESVDASLEPVLLRLTFKQARGGVGWSGACHVQSFGLKEQVISCAAHHTTGYKLHLSHSDRDVMEGGCTLGLLFGRPFGVGS